MNPFSADFATDVLRAWRTGSTRLRLLIILAGLVAVLGGGIYLIADYTAIPRQVSAFGGGLVILSLAALTVISAQQRAIAQEATERKIEAVERRFEEHPTEPRAAWDLARVKLETYLTRNLSQVRSIFWLTLVVMGIGFAIIIYGVARVYDSPATLQPSIVAACSGIVINLIGASFLVIYRATMQQAKEYVTILERINAVGMAVQILESIEDSTGELRAKTTAEIAKQLLSLYATAKPRTKTA